MRGTQGLKVAWPLGFTGCVAPRVQGVRGTQEFTGCVAPLVQGFVATTVQGVGWMTPARSVAVADRRSSYKNFQMFQDGGKARRGAEHTPRDAIRSAV